jgi:hypothetical protein
MVKVNMHSREDIVMGIVLHVGQLVTQHSDVVVVDKRYRTHHRRIRSFGRFADQFVTH